MRAESISSERTAERTAILETGGEITLPGSVLRELRLLRPEPFLVFSAGHGFLHMVRADLGPPALPAETAISLYGSLQSFGIADLFSLLNMSRRTGLLQVIDDPVKKSVWFRRGEIAFAASNQPEDRLGQILYRVGKLSQEALAEAERHLVPGKRFGAVLLERKLLDSAGLWWGIKYQIEEILYSIFRLGAGSFFFFDGNFLEEELAHFTIDTNNVLMEGYQRIDEWRLIREHIKSPRTVLVQTGRKPKEKLEERLERLLRLVDGRTTVEDLVRGTGWGEFNTYKILYKLLQAGLVTAPGGAEAKPPATPGAAPEAAALAELVEVYDRIFMLVRDVLAAKAVEVDLGRAFRVFLKNASDRTRALLQGIDAGPSRRLAVEPLRENVEHLLLIEAAGSQGGNPPRPDLRQRLLRSALAEWTAFQVTLVHNLLPSPEAAELVSYVRAIERTGRQAEG
ncbi:MAG TPA: DUF4388 domain-containing protein [Thermoanaerobaculia bacterium]|nr:DUF4388 domain-containing protein [Thermoanaerobaculia bacterium]